MLLYSATLPILVCRSAPFSPGANQPSFGIDLKVTVTTKGVWPEKDEMANLIIPEHMQQRLEQYRCFYLSLNPQRRVAWMHRSSFAPPSARSSPQLLTHVALKQRQHVRHPRALPHGERLGQGQQGAHRQPVRRVLLKTSRAVVTDVRRALGTRRLCCCCSTSGIASRWQTWAV